MADAPAVASEAGGPPAPQVSEELFRSPDLLVRKVAPHDSACCVVTFDSFTGFSTLDRPGFGETFLNNNGLDAVHVIPRENTWYDYPEMAEAMAKVHAATRGYQRVVTYGSSMGAYAAIRFAGLCGATGILALSPQFSIARASVPWETRWTEEGRRFNPRWERGLPFPEVADACVVYDPANSDVHHIASLARGFRFDAISLPHAGHPVTGCLAELGLLQGLVLAMCRGDLDKARFREDVRARLPAASNHQETVELFRSPDLLVRKVAPHGSACCVVTFDSFTDFRTLDRPGFGETFLNINGLDAVHVVPRENTWYDYAEMAEAMAKVHAATRTYQRVVTYGSSMGAYAAIRFAGLCGATGILALSPQFSITRAAAPWETRWTEEGRRFNPRWEKGLPFPSIADALVVYDPTDRDVRHIAALARGFRFDAVALPYAGHPVTGCLAELGLLHGLIMAMCRGDLDKARFRAMALEHLPRASQYLTSSAKQMPRWRRAKRLALMQRAVTVAPRDPSVYRCLGIELRKAGRFAESMAMHGRALELFPDEPNLLLEYSFSLAGSGDVPGAIRVLEGIHERAGKAIYQSQLNTMRDRLAPGPLAMLRRAGAWVMGRAR